MMDGESAATWAATSSMPSGSPSSWRQMSPTAAALSVHGEALLGQPGSSSKSATASLWRISCRSSSTSGISSGPRPPATLADNPERLSAGSQDAQIRSGRQKGLDGGGYAVDHVLAAVEEEQGVTVGEDLGHLVERVTARPLPYTEGLAQRLGPEPDRSAGTGRKGVPHPRNARRPRAPKSTASLVLPAPPGPTTVTRRQRSKM